MQNDKPHVEDMLMLWGAVYRAKMHHPTAMPSGAELASIGGRTSGGTYGAKGPSNAEMDFWHIDTFLKKASTFLYELFVQEYALGVTDHGEGDLVMLVKRWSTDEFIPPKHSDVYKAAEALGCSARELVRWRIDAIKRSLAKSSGWEYKKEGVGERKRV